MSFGDTEPSEPRRGEALSGPPHLAPHVTFERGELDRILGLYGRKVAAGEWRDYAIDHRPGMALRMPRWGWIVVWWWRWPPALVTC